MKLQFFFVVTISKYLIVNVHSFQPLYNQTIKRQQTKYNYNLLSD